MNARLTIEGSTLCGVFQAAASQLQDDLIAEMSAILRAQGYAVEMARKWETPKELCARLGITVKTFCRRRKHPLCPKPHDTIRNGKGIEYLRSHSVLDNFLASGPIRRKAGSDPEPDMPRKSVRTVF